MALMDNAEFLISHIRNSFITSDDTGMCEMILENEDNEKLQAEKFNHSIHMHSNGEHSDLSMSDSGMDSLDYELSHSHDILPDMDYGAHRRRSNTAQRLDRMKKDKRSQTKIKHIVWREAPNPLSLEARELLFEKKELSGSVEYPPIKRISMLSELLETFGNVTDNPFLEYAKFDGTANMAATTKKIDIYLTMASPRDRPFPMPVLVLASARVLELIGLICWQYTSECREPKLHVNLECYCLNIAEDDGEVDADFPCLEMKEPVSKFGFGKLALVQKATPPKSLLCSYVVTINIPTQGFSKIPVDTLNIPLREVMDKVMKKRKIGMKGLQYNLEKQSEPGTSLDLDLPLSSINTLEFCLIRQHSSRASTSEVAVSDRTSAVAESLSSHQYKSFIVSMLHKLRTNTDVQLGVSGEKVEVDPVIAKGTVKLFKQKAITLDAQTIASCEVTEERSTGKTAFRLTYLVGHEYKHIDFESEFETTLEIVQKVNNILDWRLSPIRKEFMSTKERRHQRSKRDSRIASCV